MRFVLILCALLSSSTVFAHYNEMRDDTGKLRPAYRPLKGSLESLSPAKRRQFKRKSIDAFWLDNALSPVPRVLEPEEFDLVKRGVKQRARALMAFLKDHYSGRRTYLSEGIVPEDVVRNALIRSGELGFDGLIDPEAITLFYGPDIVRAEKDGKKNWYVLEDNTGYVGGFGDLNLANDLILDLHPSLNKKMRLNDPSDFYKKLAQEFHRRAAAKGGHPVMLRGFSIDNEGLRLQETFDKLGIPTVRPYDEARLIVENKKLYLKWTDSNGRRHRERVGMLLINNELSWVDRTHPATAAQHVFDLANMYLEPGEASVRAQDRVREILSGFSLGETPSVRKLKRELIDSGYYVPERSFIPGLIESILAGHVDVIASPGTNFVGDKQLYLYVEKMIRFYLHEKPILQQPESIELTEENLDSVFENIGDWVTKRFDGRGGKTVWVGSKLKEDEIKDLRRLVEKSPEMYKAQELLQISRLDKDIVDLRLFSYLNSDRMIVANVPWGRGAPMNGDGKVNISGKGHEVAVLVGEPLRSADCEKLLK